MAATDALQSRINIYSAGLQPPAPPADPVVLRSVLDASLPKVSAAADIIAGTNTVKFLSPANLASAFAVAGYVSFGYAQGAKPNDQSAAATNTVALLNLLNNNQNVYIPPGIWYFNAGVNITRSTPLRIIAGGITTTTLAWINTSSSNPGGLYITQTQVTATITIQGMSFATDSTTGVGTALTIVYPATISSVFPSVYLNEIHTYGLNIFEHSWRQGIALSNCWNARLHNLHINGAMSAAKTQMMQVGIGCVNCTAISISRFKIYYSYEGIVIGGGPNNDDTIDEGFIITDFEIVGVNRGFYHATKVAHAGNLLANGHINSDRIGVQLYAKHKAQLCNLYLYKLTNSSQAWAGIVMQNCDNNQVNDVQFSLSAGTSGGAVGMLISGSNHNIIHDIKTNEAVNETFGGVVLVQDTSADNYIHNIKTYAGAGTAPILCSATNLTNYFDNITPSAHATLTINSATPSVGNDIYGKWMTKNTQATTITNFTDGLDARTFQLLINDANTTIQHNAGLILKGGVSVNVPNGGIMTFGRYVNIWRELTRNF